MHPLMNDDAGDLLCDKTSHIIRAGDNGMCTILLVPGVDVCTAFSDRIINLGSLTYGVRKANAGGAGPGIELPNTNSLQWADTRIGSMDDDVHQACLVRLDSTRVLCIYT
eukprot:GHVU01040116.1.p6 GENE.GHVU01040116.1~~GHVU01040116.1.p6  ORF type:complete len:110 (+),score=4.26 GHVU01040116.1:690-1019(+)